MNIMESAFENLEWFIHTPPTLENISMKVFNKKGCFTRRPLITEETNRVLFETDIRLAFPLGDHYQVFEEETLKGPITLLSLFKAIYKFYQRFLNLEHYDAIFSDNEDLEEEVLENNDGNRDQIQNIETFSDYPSPPDFVGLSQREDGVYVVDLGPV